MTLYVSKILAIVAQVRWDPESVFLLLKHHIHLSNCPGRVSNWEISTSSLIPNLPLLSSHTHPKHIYPVALLLVHFWLHRSPPLFSFSEFQNAGEGVSTGVIWRGLHEIYQEPIRYSYVTSSIFSIAGSIKISSLLPLYSDSIIFWFWDKQSGLDCGDASWCVTIT